MRAGQVTLDDRGFEYRAERAFLKANTHADISIRWEWRSDVWAGADGDPYMSGRFVAECSGFRARVMLASQNLRTGLLVVR